MDVEKLVEDGALLVERARTEAEGCYMAAFDRLLEAGVPVSTSSIEIARAVIRITLEAAAREAHRMYVDCHESNARTGAAMLRNIFQELAASIGGNRE